MSNECAESERVEQQLTCPVCLDVFEDPVIVGACGHSFCRACVAQLVGGRTLLQCPVCRAYSMMPAGGAKALTPNLQLRNVVEELRAGGALPPMEASRAPASAPAAASASAPSAPPASVAASSVCGVPGGFGHRVLRQAPNAAVLERPGKLLDLQANARLPKSDPALRL